MLFWQTDMSGTRYSVVRPNTILSHPNQLVVPEEGVIETDKDSQTYWQADRKTDRQTSHEGYLL